MDPVTHTFFGLALARSGLARKTRLGGAALVVGANFPDLDALCYLGGGSDLGLWFRRGWTHGVLALAALPWVLTGILLLWQRWRDRRPGSLGARGCGGHQERSERDPCGSGRCGGEAPRPRALLGLSFLAIASHPALDWLNTYGVRWLMPFSGRWFYGDTLFIVDPWLWLLLGGGLFLGAPPGGARRAVVFGVLASWLMLGTGRAVPLAARVAWGAGLALLVALRAWRSLPSPASTERLARAALALALGYIGAMLFLSTVTRSAVIAELEIAGVGPVGQLMVGPLPANPLAWDVVAATPHAYRWGRFSWWRSRGLELAPELVTRRSGPEIEQARADPAVKGLVNWARFPHFEIEREATGVTVYILDLRFARQRTEGFGGAAVRVEAAR